MPTRNLTPSHELAKQATELILGFEPKDTLIFQNRAKLSMILAALWQYHVRDFHARHSSFPNTTETEQLQTSVDENIRGLLELLLPYSTLGLHCATDLQRALQQLSNSTDPVVTIAIPATETPEHSIRILKKFFNKTNHLRALINRVSRALWILAITIGSAANTMRDQFYDVCNGIAYITCTLFMVRLLFTLYHIGQFSLYGGTEQEKKCSKKIRFLDSLSREGPDVLHFSVWFSIRLCTNFLVQQDANSLTLGLFSFAALKEIVLTHHNNTLYNQMLSIATHIHLSDLRNHTEQASKTHFVLFARTALTELQKKDNQQRSKLIIFWMIYALGALISRIGNSSNSLMTAGASIIALNVVVQIAWEFLFKKDIYALVPRKITEEAPQLIVPVAQQTDVLATPLLPSNGQTI